MPGGHRRGHGDRGQRDVGSAPSLLAGRPVAGGLVHEYEFWETGYPPANSPEPESDELWLYMRCRRQLHRLPAAGPDTQ